MIRISLISLLLLCCHLVSGQKAQSYFDKGMDLYNKKQCSQAFNAFNEAMNLFRSYEKADKQVVGMAYYWMGKTLNDLPNCNLFYKAIDYFIRAADKGYAPAYTALGVAYATGIQEGKAGVKDENKALTYFQKAAELGDAAGQYHLASYYLNGTAIKKDEAKAMQLLIQAILGGNKEAVAALKELDRQKVKNEFQKLAKKKLTDAEQYNVANYFHAAEDYQEAFVWFQKSAERDNMEAQGIMGFYYESGSFGSFGIPLDLQKAHGWYLKSAENGYAMSQYLLGRMYSEGKGVPKDLKKALGWYEKAANNGNSLAQNWIADYYYSQEDYRQAAEWYLKAAENESYISQNRLGGMYYEGKGVTKDLKKAFEWFLKSAEQNWHWGQYNVGTCYEYGEGVGKNIDKAYEWYLKAANNDNSQAQYKMGTRCQNLVQNEQAANWYQKSAIQGFYAAQYQLGLLYFHGAGVTKDSQKAFEWFTKSAETKYSHAQYMLGVCYETGAGVEKSSAKAMEWYLKSAEQDNATAQNYLGVAYLNGEITGKDAIQAVKWFTKSAGQNNRDAQYNLAGCYERGEGVAKDETTAKEWYREAYANGHQGAKEALDRITAAQLQLAVNGSSADGTEINVKKSDRGRIKPATLADWNKPVMQPFENIVMTQNTKIVYVSRVNRNISSRGDVLTGTFNSGRLPIYHADKKRWGVLDRDGNLVIDYIYRREPQFSEGVCVHPVFDDSKFDAMGTYRPRITDYQIIDTKGKVVTTVKATHLNDFNMGVTMGFKSEGGQFEKPTHSAVYYDKYGQSLVSYPAMKRNDYMELPEFRELHEGRRAYYDINQKLWGFLDENGKIVLSARHREVGDFSDGLALFRTVRDNQSYWGYIDQWGNIVIEAKFSNKPLPFSHGYAIAIKRDNSKCLIDKKGSIVLDNFRDMTQFYKGYAILSVEGGYYLVDTNFNRLKKVRYFPDYTDKFDGTIKYIDDLTLARSMGDMGNLIDYMGNIINESGNCIFREGRAWARTTVKLQNGKEEFTQGYINTKGEFVFIFREPEF